MVNSFHKEFPYVKLKDAVAYGEVPMVVIDFSPISKKLISKSNPTITFIL